MVFHPHLQFFPRLWKKKEVCAKRKREDGKAMGERRESGKTMVQKVRDAQELAHQTLGKFDQNAASQSGTVVSASSKRRGGALYKYPNKLGGEKEKNEKKDNSIGNYDDTNIDNTKCCSTFCCSSISIHDCG
jgi:hypothetical protein